MIESKVGWREANEWEDITVMPLKALAAGARPDNAPLGTPIH